MIPDDGTNYWALLLWITVGACVLYAVPTWLHHRWRRKDRRDR